MSANQERIKRLTDNGPLLLEAIRVIAAVGRPLSNPREAFRSPSFRQVELPSGTIVLGGREETDMSDQWAIGHYTLIARSMHQEIASVRWGFRYENETKKETPKIELDATWYFISDPFLAELGSVKALVEIWQEKHQKELVRAAQEQDAVIESLLKHGRKA